MDRVPINEKISEKALYLYFAFKAFTAAISLASIVLGYKLFILGVTGQASLSIESRSVKGQLLNAAPGLFFAVGGIVALIMIVWKGVQISFTQNGSVSGMQTVGRGIRKK